jgi:FMN-dependent oxidoreductase (nitrilotriacetate monooxygenase family)
VAQSETMHLAFDLSFLHTEGRWALPGSWVGWDYYPNPALYQDLARVAERAKLDMLFFGDGTGIPDNWEGSLDGGVKWGIQWPRHDKTPLIALMSAVASNVGFCATFSPTFMHPYYVARLMASLDHLTAGRVALNVITSTRPADAANYGFDSLMEHNLRYERCEEFIDVCRQLWASVEPDAIVLDRATGQFADPTKVRAINHRGEFWNVRGPLNCLPSPQGRPVLIQAGQSDRGIASSAKFADVVFAGGGNIDFMKRHRAFLDSCLLAEGRQPRDIGILWSTSVVVGETKSEARAKLRQLADSLSLEAAGAYLSYNNGYDFSQLPPKFSLGEARDAIEAAEATQMGFIQRLIMEFDENTMMTLDELLERGRLQMVGAGAVCGTAEEIADYLEEQHFATGANGGFMIQGAVGPQPRTLLDFAELVVPELQRRGLFRREYEGTTLRDRLTA